MILVLRYGPFEHAMFWHGTYPPNYVHIPKPIRLRLAPISDATTDVFEPVIIQMRFRYRKSIAEDVHEYEFEDEL